MGQPIQFYSGKKVAVTGATGLIGSYAVKLLKQSGAIVRAVTHHKNPNAFTEMADEIHERDLQLPLDAWEAVKDQEIVIGCAGITGGVNLPKIDPVSYVGPATNLVINQLQACVEGGVKRFGFLSSTTVYPPSDKPCVEDDAETLEARYPLYRGIGLSKWFLEKLCRYYQDETNLEIGIIRPSGAYGRFDNFDEKSSHVLPGMINRAMQNHGAEEFEVWGDGKDVRDFIHAEDVARCLLLTVAFSPSSVPINCASGVPITTAELADKVLDAVKSKAKIVFKPGKPTALRKRLVDTKLAYRLLGFKPQISLEEGIKDVVEWRKKQ